MAEAKEVTEEKKPVDIYPLKKGKRVLLYLADAFLCFFFALFLFHVVAYPLAGLTLEKLGVTERMTTLQAERDGVLYGKKLLFAKESEDPAYFNDNLSYTAEGYIAYLVGDESKKDFDVLRTYYIDLRQDQAGYAALFKDYDKTASFFDLSGDLPSLSEKYVAEWKPYFDPKDQMSEQGKTDMATFQKTFFLPSYRRMLASIQENDLVYQGVSYKESQEAFYGLSGSYDMATVISVYLSYFLSWGVCFVLVPLTNENRKTLGMLAMRIERIDPRRLAPCTRGEALLHGVFDFASGAVGILFLPIAVTSFNELFSLPTLFPLSMVSLAFVLASLIFLLVDPFGRTLSDRLSFGVAIDEETLNQIYRAKGYKV